jgi:hypothetical protein
MDQENSFQNIIISTKGEKVHPKIRKKKQDFIEINKRW